MDLFQIIPEQVRSIDGKMGSECYRMAAFSWSIGTFDGKILKLKFALKEIFEFLMFAEFSKTKWYGKLLAIQAPNICTKRFQMYCFWFCFHWVRDKIKTACHRKYLSYASILSNDLFFNWPFRPYRSQPTGPLYKMFHSKFCIMCYRVDI